MREYKFINKCRLCNSKDLLKVINFGKIPLGNNFSLKKNESHFAKLFPLELNFCKKCRHCQLSISVNPSILYQKNYTYLSSIGSSFIEHFNNYYLWILKKTKIPNNSLILDVGSNDGTCLSFFKKKFKVCGIDPATKPVKIANRNNIYTVNNFLNDKSSKKILNKFGKFDLITSHNVLAHVDDINNVFFLIYRMLKNNGYFCFEVGYFLKVIKNNFFDTIYHEHLDYHNAQSMVKFLYNYNFSIINISTNKAQGGSIRFLCRKLPKKKISNQVLNFIKKEKNTNLINLINLKKWNTQIDLQIERLKEIINQYYIKNKIIVGYGAPTKATLWIKFLELNSKKIKFVVEDNNLKINKFFPKTDIKIVEINKLLSCKIDLIIIFAWNFKKDIIKKLKKMKIKNVNIITPLPNLIKNRL